VRRNDSKAAFTLVELVVVIAIVACLATLLVPTVTAMQQRADATACSSNLRQVGIAGLLYAGDHGQTTPVIEPWPSQPVYPASADAQTILAALQPYGLTAATLHCHADIVGPNYFAKEGSSYEWCPMANGQNLHSIKLFLGGNMPTLTLPRLIVAFDYCNVHNNASNVLFGDGHVAAAIK